MAGLRNQVVFAPAGSGKTERLSNRYIELLEARVPPERILTLTFTEKAAAEMKERIFARLAERNPALHRELRENALKLRVSTIHSFCLTLLRRFASTLGLDPRVDVLADPAELWTAVKYDTLMSIAEDGPDARDFNLLVELITRDERIGWARLSGLFDEFFARRVNIARGRVEPVDRALLARLATRLRTHPLTGRLDDPAILPAGWDKASVRAALDALEARRDIFLTKGGTPRKPRGKGREEERDWNELCAGYHGLLRQDAFAAEFRASFKLFRERFLEAYTRRKHDSGRVDYDDMEFMALGLLTTDHDWQNVLRAFDEHTDHLLVDEFQDTSFLQWGIIDKLTEEWRAGEGAKAARNIEPTVFLVGDEKQSIYLFRDARVEVFSTAADKLEEWLGAGKLERVTLEDNYRSLQAIIDFTNEVFSRLMSPTSQAVPDSWRTRYAPFKRARANTAPGRVEIILAPCAGPAGERRDCDAATVARRIRGLTDPADPFTVYDRNPDKTETGRPCRFGDVGIILRSRALLPAIENALRACDVPFLVAGGTGFYQEPEIRYLIALTAALVDPADDLALYATLRGPVFAVPEADLFLANTGKGLTLLDRIRAAAPGTSLAEPLAVLDRCRARVPFEPLARILERLLAERRAWETFWEPQRLANLRKLLAIIEDRAADGEGPLRVLRALQDTGDDEAKADVRPEGLDAVQVMTVHAAKGLQFPVTFFPGLDETIRPMHRVSGEPLVIEEVAADDVLVSWLPDAGLRRGNAFHMTHREKEIEEEKRVFYVACTRARDGLFLTGTLHDRALDNTRLGWLVESLDLRPDEFALAPGREIPGVTVRNAADIPEPRTRITRAQADRPRPRAVRPPTVAPGPRIEAITRNLPQDYTRHPDDAIGLGDAVHRILELISSGRLTPADIERCLTSSTPVVLSSLPPVLHSDLGIPTSDFARTAIAHVARLIADPAAWSIIAPQPDSEAELPVMYADGPTLRSGRIDRVILAPGEIRIYDYKTFPVKADDIPALAREYHEGQLRHYAAALAGIYPDRNPRTFLIFTALPTITETGI